MSLVSSSSMICPGSFFGGSDAPVHLAEALSPPTFAEGSAVTVVMASRGYPESSSSGDVITGIDAAEALEGVHVIHAGTALDASGNLVTAGGRVLAVTAVGADLSEARERAYAGVGAIEFDGAQWRGDITLRAASSS